jgi:sugar phosphate isomerase/epimerase
MIVAPLAYSTNGFTTRPLIESLKLIASCGYKGVELLGDRPHWQPPPRICEGLAHALNTREIIDETLRQYPAPQEIRKILNDLDLTVSNVNGNTAMFFWPTWMPETVFEPALSHPDSRIRTSRLESTRALIDWAAQVGAPRVSVTSGRCPGGCPPEEGLNYFVESLRMLVEYAAPQDEKNKL